MQDDDSGDQLPIHPEEYILCILGRRNDPALLQNIDIWRRNQVQRFIISQRNDRLFTIARELYDASKNSCLIRKGMRIKNWYADDEALLAVLHRELRAKLWTFQEKKLTASMIRMLYFPELLMEGKAAHTFMPKDVADAAALFADIYLPSRVQFQGRLSKKLKA